MDGQTSVMRLLISEAPPCSGTTSASKWPTRPWARIYVDFAGPLFGKMFLVVIDAHYFCTLPCAVHADRQEGPEEVH